MFKFFKKKTSQFKDKYVGLKDAGKERLKNTKEEVNKDIKNFKTLKDKPETEGAIKLRNFRKILILPTFILALMIFLNGFYAIALVEGNSMDHTLKDKQFVVIEKQTYVKTGDVIVFTDKEKYPETQTVVKRIMAMPGETISCKKGIVYVNGEPVEQPYISTETEDFSEVTVPENTVFVMGDNRQHSLDSRKVGCISINSIMGRVMGYSLNEKDYAKENEEVYSKVLNTKEN